LKPKSKDFFEYLEKPRSVRTLLCLLSAENKGLDELLREIGGSKSTGMARIDELVRLGLVLKKASQTEKRKMLYCLNEKGKRLAEQIQKTIDSIDQ
jgi:DNA-binding MarR family transcriptional regulator